MDILTLELFDVTVSQALLKVRGTLEQHPTMPLRILVDFDDMVRSNLERFLARQGRPAATKRMGDHWQLDVPEGMTPLAPPDLTALAAPLQCPSPTTYLPVVILRSAFAPGDRALGRQLLLGVLKNLEPSIPWVLLAHDALELLDDPRALECLHDLERRGLSIRVSETSLRFLGRPEAPFAPMDDAQWQALLGKGELTVV